jgi:MFS transporter, DHA1 family, tetracycline resistance protein
MKDKNKKTESSNSQEETELEHFIVSSSSCETMETIVLAGNDDSKTEPILTRSSSDSPPSTFSSPHHSHHHQHDDRIPSSSSTSTSSSSSSSAAAPDDNNNSTGDGFVPITTEQRQQRQQQHPHEPQAQQQQQQQRGGGFFMEFITAQGPPQITVLLILLAFSFGSTVGVVPAVMSDRFARLHYGYGSSGGGSGGGGSDGNDDTPPPCYSYNSNAENMPAAACHAGYAAAQNALATEMLVAHAFTFVSCSWVGALSDEHGRRVFFILGIALATLHPLTLLLIQVQPNMSPWWYYGVAGPLQGIVSWSTVALSSLTDAIPHASHRAPSFGLAMAGVAMGFTLGPLTVLILGHVGVTILSLVMICLALILAIFYLPETRTPQAAARAKSMRQQQQQKQQQPRNASQEDDGTLFSNNNNDNINKKQSSSLWTWWYLYRPLWELSILNRHALFRRLSLIAFLCGIVSSGDKSLVLYYIQEHLAFTDADIAKLFVVVGLLGIFSQACLLKLLNDAMGERRVVILALSLGTIHNALYGLAEAKRTIFLAAGIAATIVSLAHPTLLAILSNNVDACEYGRIQGALASLQSLAAAFGPMTLRCVYHFTKDGGDAGGTTTGDDDDDNAFFFRRVVGPGSMFLFAAGLYATAACCSYFLPPVRCRRPPVGKTSLQPKC